MIVGYSDKNITKRNIADKEIAILYQVQNTGMKTFLTKTLIHETP